MNINPAKNAAELNAFSAIAEVFTEKPGFYSPKPAFPADPVDTAPRPRAAGFALPPGAIGASVNGVFHSALNVSVAVTRSIRIVLSQEQVERIVLDAVLAARPDIAAANPRCDADGSGCRVECVVSGAMTSEEEEEAFLSPSAAAFAGLRDPGGADAIPAAPSPSPSPSSYDELRAAVLAFLKAEDVLFKPEGDFDGEQCGASLRALASLVDCDLEDPPLSEEERMVRIQRGMHRPSLSMPDA